MFQFTQSTYLKLSEFSLLKKTYLRNKIFNNNNKIYSAGIAYGNSKREIKYAKKTLKKGIKIYVKLFDEYKNTVIPFMESVEKLF